MSQEKFDVTIVPVNATYAKIFCDSSILFELVDNYTFMVDGYKYAPSYRSGAWSGERFMISKITRQVYIGLVPEIVQYCIDNGYSVDNQAKSPSNEKITLEVVENFCEQLNIHSRGQPIEVRPYQIEAIFHAIKNSRATLVSPTSSGKSLIIYCITRWYLLNNKKILLLVPNLGLIAQMYSDFADYSTENGWIVADHAQMIHGGKSKTVDRPLVIANWQSIYNTGKTGGKSGKPADGIAKNFFSHFDAVFNDETHLAKAKSISGIMEKCINATKRFGLTGTMSGVDCDKLVIEGLFGPVFNVITTKELMDAGAITKLKIKCLKLNYSDEVKKNSSKLTYQEEMNYLVTSPDRNNFICKLAASQKGNTIIFFNFVEKQGKVMKKMLEDLCGDKKTILYISGEVKLDDREDIRKMIAERNDLIILGSIACIGTGFSAPNLHVGIFASPCKSKIRVLQTIGRLLRLSSGKNDCTLYDLVDDLTWKSHKNFTWNWFMERVKYYCETKFDYKILDIPKEHVK